MKPNTAPIDLARLADNPNPNATIGFILIYPVHFYFYKNIYKHLRKEAEFIIDLGAFFPVEQPQELLEAILALLKEHHCHFRILHYEDYYYASYLDDFFSQYEVLVSLWPNCCISLKTNLLRRRVSLMYGAGKNLNTFRPSQRNWDLYLSYGHHDFDILRLYTNAVIVGNPKFDDWFNGTLDAVFLDQLRSRLNPSKKTLLYLPTHSDLGSLKALSGPLKDLSTRYNIVVKLHHFNVTDEPELVAKLEHPSLIIFKDDTDLLPLLRVADVVLSDNSSAIFDAILADKPLVLADFLTKEFLEHDHRQVKSYRRGIVRRPITYSGSIEQRIKKEGLVLTIQHPQELGQRIHQALEDTPFYQNARKEIRENVFAFNDGRCGERAAQALRDLLQSEVLPEKPILYHALEAFENETLKRSFSGQIKDARRIAEYEKHLLKKIEEENATIIFSIVVFHDPAETALSPDHFRATLRSLFEQQFSGASYEILVVSDSSLVHEAGRIAAAPQDSAKRPALKTLMPSSKQTPFKWMENALKEAQGEIMCFLQSGCLAPSRWLLDQYLAYKRHPQTAGVGGFVVKHQGSVWDEYYYWELAKKQGLQKEPAYLQKLSEIENNLFYQNPTGTLSNMSYRKTLLQNLKIPYAHIATREILEILLKQGILGGGHTLCFHPSHVVDLEKMTWKDFVSKNIREGTSLSYTVLGNHRYRRYYMYNLLSPFSRLFSSFFNDHARIALSVALFVGTFFRWIGKVYGFLILQRHRYKPR